MDVHGGWWAWGSGGSGQLGLGTTADHSLPCRLPPLPTLGAGQLQALVGGSTHTLGLTREGDVWAWGCGDDGRLGLGAPSARHEQPTPQRVVLPETVVQVAAGWSHSLALAASGKVLCWGSSGFNQIGCLYEEDEEAAEGEEDAARSRQRRLVRCRPVPAPMAGLHSSIVVTSIAAGMRHSALVTQEGHLLTLGHGKFGELGHGDLATRSTPTLVAHLAESRLRVVQVACGQKHTVCLTDDGSVFAWGDNSHGQLGIGADSAHSPHRANTNTIGPTTSTLASPSQGTADGVTPTTTTSSSSSKLKSRMIIRGTRHRRGETCHATPRPVNVPADKVSKIVCGWSFTLIVAGVVTQDDGGSLFGCGRNNYGQLGLGDTTDRPRPTRIPSEAWNDAPVDKVVCGCEHTLLLAGGQLFSWGWNEHGNLGVGHEHDLHSPTPVSSSSVVTDVCCGGCHSFACERDR